MRRLGAILIGTTLCSCTGGAHLARTARALPPRPAASATSASHTPSANATVAPSTSTSAPSTSAANAQPAPRQTLHDGDIVSGRRHAPSALDTVRGSMPASAAATRGYGGGRVPNPHPYAGRGAVADSDPNDAVGHGRSAMTDSDPSDRAGGGRAASVASAPPSSTPAAPASALIVEESVSPGPRPAPDATQGQVTFVEARSDALATFSLDVDTGSYTRARAALTAGSLPAPDEVRVEEFVNFFDYDDPAPTPGSGVPFGVRLESAPSPFDPRLRVLRIGVHGELVPETQRAPANLVFLVDVSGSMSAADKLPLVQYALHRLVDALQPEDHIGIVVYAGADAVALEPTPVAQRGRILAAIDGLTAAGYTHGAAGIRAAYDMAAQHFRAGGINRVVLCTDGDFNVGVTGPALVSVIEQERRRGITLSAIGFGLGDYNDATLEGLADHGDGNYAYVDSPNEALRVFSRDLAGTLQVIARDAKVQVAFDPAVVRRFRVVGYENRRLAHAQFADDAVDAAEVGSGDDVTALIEYELAPGVDPATDARPLAEVRVRWKAPGEDASQLRTYTLATNAAAPRFADASPSLRFGTAVARFAETLRGSAPDARFDDVARIAAEAHLPGPEAAEFVELVRDAQRLWPGHER